MATLWNERENMAAAHGDFIIYYSGAQIFLDGKGKSLYDFNTQKVYQDTFKIPFRTDPLPYNHPPYQLLLFVPLTLFPYAYAFMIWGIVNCILLATMIWLLSPLVDAKNRVLGALLGGAFFPVITAFWQGQDSILSAFLLSVVIRNLKGRRDRLAGLTLALGLYKPQLVLPIALFFAARGHWASFLTFTATGSCLVVISILMIGWDGALQYISLLRWMDNTHYTIDPLNMANLRGAFENLKMVGLPDGFVDFTMLLSSIGVFYLSISLGKAHVRLDGATTDLRMAQLVVVTILVSYHLYVHDLTLLIIPLMVCFNRDGTAGTSVMTAVPLITLVALSMPVVEMLLSQRLLSWAAFGLMALLFVFSRELCRANSSGEKWR